ncbi:hypothetical protein CHS0354_001688 [Potamilus streckersoni]|uniref:P2X purinoreceptor 7 intracellular domain-containing protein n=1 Tax=Potamilus streckersoni TaxID=2493646 RepID=A0AAE0RZR2_9BIVA|nr:hypothetical protein CHS0354_001688 [Potamilus streckersoni]
MLEEEEEGSLVEGVQEGSLVEGKGTGREPSRRGTGRESSRRGTRRESSRRGTGRESSRRGTSRIQGPSVRTEVATTAEARDHQLKERIANMTHEAKDNILAQICQKHPNMVFEVLNCSSVEQQGYHPRPGESPSWRICSNCREMPTDEEKQCCKQILPNCYSKLPDFDLVVLDEVVLLVAQRYTQDALTAEEDNDYGGEACCL